MLATEWVTKSFIISLLNFTFMKKAFLFTLFTLITFCAFAQEIWIEAAAKGGYGISFLHNSNIIDDDSYNYKITSTYGFGAKLAVNFGPYHGISIDGIYNTLGQNFEYDLPGAKNLKNEISWKNLDAYFLYRYTRNRVFLELGPMYSFVQEVKQTDAGIEFQEAENNYEHNYLSGVFGWGGYLAGSETFSLVLGMRLHYGLTNFVNSDGQKLGLPNFVNYPDNKKTRPAFIQVMMEFNFGIGRFAKAQCNKRMQFFRARR
ncbi:MAG: hypothetical protein ACI9XO_000222 [Paraglaciecola sp.]